MISKDLGHLYGEFKRTISRSFAVVDRISPEFRPPGHGIAEECVQHIAAPATFGRSSRLGPIVGLFISDLSTIPEKSTLIALDSSGGPGGSQFPICSLLIKNELR